MPENDNESAIRGMPAHPRDPHGQAALLLVESLIHGLVERLILTTAEAIDVIDTAKDVQAELAAEADGAGGDHRQSHALLSAMADSLHRDSIGAVE